MVFVLVLLHLLALWSPRLGKREMVCVLLVHLFVCFVRVCHFSLPLDVGVWCGLWLWHSLDFLLIFYTKLYYVLSRLWWYNHDKADVVSKSIVLANNLIYIKILRLNSTYIFWNQKTFLWDWKNTKTTDRVACELPFCWQQDLHRACSNVPRTVFG